MRHISAARVLDTRDSMMRIASVVLFSLLLTVMLNTGLARAAGADIGREKAVAIAYEHAGVNTADVSSLKVERDRDDGRIVYEIDFRTADTKYEYEIDGASGEILEYEFDARKPSHYPASGADRVGEAKARSIALAHAGVAADQARIVKIARYSKRGVLLYDIIFLSGGNKYSYEIDAASGEVVAYYRK